MHMPASTALHVIELKQPLPMAMGSYTLVTHSPYCLKIQILKAYQNIETTGSAKTLGNQLCVSCHRGFLSPITGHDLFIPALEDWKPFRHSGYNRHKATRVDLPTSQNQCISCHMPLKKDESGKTIHDHGFMGGILPSPLQVCSRSNKKNNKN